MNPSILDSRDEIKKLDASNVLGSVEALPDQIQDAWEKTKGITVPDEYKTVTSVVVSGMGGSALGSRVIQSLFKESLKVPFEVVNDYSLPTYVSEKTLVLLSSYSGITEETLFCAKEAQEKGAKIAIITAGGELKALAEKLHCPSYIINPVYNPSNQPRMAIGYSVFGQLGLFSAMGLLHVTDEEVNAVVTLLRKNAQGLTVESKDKNGAKYLAYASVDKMLFLVSSEHLQGAVHVFNNQLNENAKNMTTELHIPELNHHYMEGLGFPKVLREEVLSVFFNSQLYAQRIQKRYPLTLDVVEQQGLHGEMVMALAGTRLEQVFEIIQLGAYTNFYLAMLNGVNPAPIPWVDYFKQQLGK